MRIQRSWVLCVLTITAMAIAGHETWAQSYPYPGSAPAAAPYGSVPQGQPDMLGPAASAPSFAPQYAPENVGAMGMMPASYGAYGPPAAPGPYTPQGPMMPPGGPYGYQPAGYYDPTQGAPPQQLNPSPAMPMVDASGPMPEYGGSEYMGEGQPCMYCGGYGCEMCAGACDDFDLNLLRWLLPYGAGGCGAQRWYDASADWVYLKRDDIGSTTIFATEGPDGIPVLGSEQLDFPETSGFRASFAIQLGAGNLLETTYLGAFNWASKSEVTNGFDDLFSIISDYGLDPPFGFTDTDRASVQRIEYSSTFDTIELNYRQRWAGPNTRLQGSWLVGVRYMNLVEDFNYLTFAPANPGWMNYFVSTSNSLTGAQLGGDLWVCIIPGLSIGSEAKVGLYGNHATQRTTIEAYSIVDPIRERVTENGAAFLGDANVTLLWRLSQNWTFKAGYMFLWMDQVALAANNFNPEPPFVADARYPVINNSSDVFYHGALLGLEYMW